MKHKFNFLLIKIPQIEDLYCCHHCHHCHFRSVGSLNVLMVLSSKSSSLYFHDIMFQNENKLDTYRGNARLPEGPAPSSLVVPETSSVTIM